MSSSSSSSSDNQKKKEPETDIHNEDSVIRMMDLFTLRQRVLDTTKWWNRLDMRPKYDVDAMLSQLITYDDSDVPMAGQTMYTYCVAMKDLVPN